MQLWAFISLRPTVPPHPHISETPQLWFFFFFLSVSATLLVRYLLLVILAPTALLYLMWLYFCVFGSQVWSTSALFWLCEGLISSFKSTCNARVCVFHGNSTVYKALCQTEHTQKYRLGSRPLKMHSYPLSPTLFMNHCLSYVFIRHLEALTPPMMPRSLYKSVSCAWIIRAEAGVCGKRSELWDFLIDSGGLCEHVCLVLI